jgi:hypothetical protein
MDILTIAVSSTVISALVSSLIAGWFNLRSKNDEYANAYYKMILERRIAAYEEVEQLIVAIKVSVVDIDERPYHWAFSGENEFSTVYKLLHGMMSNALWLTDELFELTRQLNFLVYEANGPEQGLVEFGKKNYKTVAELRTKLERTLANDMLVLHDIRAFLKRKKPTDTYISLPPHT